MDACSLQTNGGEGGGGARVVRGVHGQMQRWSTLISSSVCGTANSVAVDPNTGMLFAACSNGVFSFNGTTVTSLLGSSSTYCPSPTHIIYDTTGGNVYVACYGTGTSLFVYTVVMINAASKIASYPMSAYYCAGAVNVAYDSFRSTLYAACINSGIMKYTASSGVTTALSTSICPAPTALVYDSIHHTVYATCEAGTTTPPTLMSIAGSSISTVANSTCTYPKALAYDTVHSIIYAACASTTSSGFGGVLSFNGSNSSLVLSSNDCFYPDSVYFDSALSVLHVACSYSVASRIVTVNAMTGAVMTIADMSQCPIGYGVSYYPGGSLVFAACGSGGVIGINGAIATKLSGASQCYSAVYDDLYSAVYAGCVGGLLNVSRVAATTTVIMSASQCPGPSAVDFDSVHRIIYVGCATTGTASVFAIYSNATIVPIASSSQCYSPSFLHYDSSSGVLYATCGGSVVTIGATVTPISNGPASCIYAAAVDSYAGTVYAACGGYGALKIVGATSTLLIGGYYSSGPCTYANGVAYDPVHSIVYVACGAAGLMSINSGGAVTTVAGPAACTAASVTVDDVHGVVYATCSTSSLAGAGVISFAGGTVINVATGSQCLAPGLLSFDTAHSTALVACTQFGGGITDNVLAITSWSCPPGYGFSFDDISCTICPSGTYGLALPNQQARCAPCATGYYSSIPGSTVCSLCDLGQFTNTSMSCTSCPGGRYGNQTSLSSPLCSGACPAGYYCPVNSVIPSRCGFAGLYCPANSSLPIIVSPGNYSVGGVDATTRTGIASCQPGFFCVGGVSAACQTGTFTNVTQASACTACDPGYYTVGIGATNCAACSPGSYIGAGSLVCLLCPPGKYGATYALSNSSCSGDCAPGYYCPWGSLHATACGSADVYCPLNTAAPITIFPGYYGVGGNATTRTDVLPCPVGSACSGGVMNTCQPGSFAAITMATSCTLCQPGQANSASNASTCYPCLTGSFAVSLGSVSCSPCPQGSYAPSNSSTACSLCSPGTFSNNSQCLLCSAGSFASMPGLTACLPCSPGSYSNYSDSITLLTQCTLCGLGTVSAFSNSTVCTPCPAGSVANLPGMLVCQPCSLGTYSMSPGQSACLPCPAGMFTTSTNATTCSNCSAGFYSSQPGSTGCAACWPGTFSPTPSLSSCTACAAGLISSVWNSTSCTGCSLGLYADQPGLSVCQQCLPGSYGSGSAQSSCTACGVGTFSASLNTTVCSNCTVGFFAGLPGMSTCQPCSLGTIATSMGQSACLPCPAGTFTISTNATTCVDCPAGFYSSQPASTSCGPCSPGTYSSPSVPHSLSTCAACGAGNYSASWSATACSPCWLGSFALSVGSTTCLPCVPGSYTNVSGTSFCSSCVAGTFGPNSSATACAVCGDGQYAGGAGMTACTSCERGRYSNSQLLLATSSPTNTSRTAADTTLPVGASICAECPIGTESGLNFGATQCRVCPLMTFSGTPQTVQCIPCLPGTYSMITGATSCAACPSPGVTCVNGSISVDPGYFVTTSTAATASNNGQPVLMAVPCPPDKCVGGNLGSGVCSVNRIQTSSNSLCGSCLPDYSDFAGECVYCPSWNVGLIFVFLLASFCYVAFLHRSAQATEMDPLPILLYFVQIVLLVLGNVNSYMQWLSFFNMQPGGSASSTTSAASSSSKSTSVTDFCLGPLHGLDIFKVSYIVPAIFFTELAVLFLCVQLVTLLRMRWKHKGGAAGINKDTTMIVADAAGVNEGGMNGNGAGADGGTVGKVLKALSSVIPTSRNSFVRTVVALLLYTYTGLCTNTLAYFQCVSVESTSNGVTQQQQVVYSVPAVDCSSTDYKRFSVLVYLFLILDVIGIPILIAAFLVLRRHDVQQFYRFRAEQATAIAAASTSANTVGSAVPLERASTKRVQHQHSSSHTAMKSAALTSSEPASSTSTTYSFSLSSLFTREVVEPAVAASRRPIIQLPSASSSSSSPFTLSFEFTHRYGILFQHYKKECSGWLVVILIRRTVCSALVTGLRDDTSGRSLALLLVHFFALLLHLYFSPYRHRVNNALETFNLTMLTIIAAITASYQHPPFSLAMQVIVCLLIVFTIVVCVIVIATATILMGRRPQFYPNAPTTTITTTASKAEAPLALEVHKHGNEQIELDVLPLPSSASSASSSSSSSPVGPTAAGTLEFHEELPSSAASAPMAAIATTTAATAFLLPPRNENNNLVEPPSSCRLSSSTPFTVSTSTTTVIDTTTMMVTNLQLPSTAPPAPAAALPSSPIDDHGAIAGETSDN